MDVKSKVGCELVTCIRTAPKDRWLAPVHRSVARNSGKGAKVNQHEHRFAEEALEGYVRGLLSRFLPDHCGSVLRVVYPFLATGDPPNSS
jgi:hypothetical protein